MNSRLRKILLAILVFVAMYAAIAIALRLIGLENAQRYVHRAGVWAPLIFVLVCAVGLVAAPLSASSIFVTGGVVFGKEPAFILSYVGTLIGCSINFFISKKLGRRVVTRFIGEEDLAAVDKFTERLETHHSIFYMMALMPLSQDIVSYAVGLTKVDYRHFLVALMISSGFIVAAYVYLGSSLLETLL